MKKFMLCVLLSGSASAGVVTSYNPVVSPSYLETTARQIVGKSCDFLRSEVHYDSPEEVDYQLVQTAKLNTLGYFSKESETDTLYVMKTTGGWIITTLSKITAYGNVYSMTCVVTKNV